MDGSQFYRDNIGSIRRSVTATNTPRTPDRGNDNNTSEDKSINNNVAANQDESTYLTGRALFIRTQYQTEAGQNYINHKPLRHQYDQICHEKDRMPRGKNSSRGELVHWIDKTTAKGVKLSRDPLP
mmetsp:Transcript_12232/g.14770  ORF Transcript_12232/g.14770 Transcript_12232/m.14770 type:complete len:126 (+) Transcript_12232:169-546(+)